MTFKFNIGDAVQTSNGAMVGVVHERFYHEWAGGVRIRYVIFGRIVSPHTFIGSKTSYEEFEGNLEPCNEAIAEAEWLPLPRREASTEPAASEEKAG